MRKYYLNKNAKQSFVFENNKKNKLQINSKRSFKDAKLAAAFHGALTLEKQIKSKSLLKRYNFHASTF